MTWNSKPLKIPKPKPSKIIQPEDLAGDSEDSQQMALFAWAALNTETYPQLKNLFAIPIWLNVESIRSKLINVSPTHANIFDSHFVYSFV